MTQIKGWHVLTGFILGFGIIISVNLVLAFNAVRSFPGLEVKNSYVASQSFERDRSAQDALGWAVAAWLDNGELHLRFDSVQGPVQPDIAQAIFGQATSIAQDQYPEFQFENRSFVAPVDVDNGNWNLRLKARAADGTEFAQRVIVLGDRK